LASTNERSDHLGHIEVITPVAAIRQAGVATAIPV